MPHIIRAAVAQKKVVIVGGGPAGLEAARISALRGHDTLIFEASDRLGGQLNLASKGLTRRQIAGVVDWLVQEVDLLGVDVRLNQYAEAQDVIAEKPDMVVVATGGWPNEVGIPGGDMAISSWEILGGDARVSGKILLIDEIGDQSAAVCADFMARQGCTVSMVTPDRAIAHDLGPTNSSVVLRDLALQNVTFECFHELLSLETDGNRKKATLRHVLTDATEVRIVDHVVVEHGAAPMDAIYHELKDYSRNAGQLDQAAVIAGTSPFVDSGTDGDFYLARIGDAVAGRNIHAALYDALRVCKDI